MIGMVQVAARAIAAGFIDGDRLRVTVSLMPDPQLGTYRLQDWPKIAPALEASLRIEFQLPAAGQKPRSIVVAPTFPAPTKRREKLLKLWGEVVAPSLPGLDTWADLLTFMLLNQARGEDRRLVENPTIATALAMGFSRGRLALDAIAGPGAPLLARSGGGTGRVRLASLGRSTNDATADTGWPTAEGYADAALGDGGGMQPLLDKILDHHAAAAPASMALRPDDTPELVRAGQRLGTVLASPLLQRLFGLAIDVTVPVAILRDVLPEGGPLLVGLVNGPGRRIWTRAGFQDGLEGRRFFGPVTDTEYAGSAGDSRAGVELLDASGHYELCTLDPDLSVQSTLVVAAMRTSGQARADQVQTLRSGGFRLLDRDAKSRAASRREMQKARFSNRADTEAIDDADSLLTGERLDLGLDTPSGVQWRSAMHRTIRYAEPHDTSGWVETELERLVGPAAGHRRMELEAGTVVRALVTAEQDKDEVPQTVAAWSGDPMGAGLLGKTDVRDSEHAIHLWCDVSLPSAGEYGRWALAMPMRFGWPYRAGLRRVHLAGVALSLEEAALAYAEPGVSLPSSGTGRRLLRHERVGPPSLGMTLAEHRRPSRHVPVQALQHAVVRSSTVRDQGTPERTVRMLLAPTVPLEFAVLHDVFPGKHSGSEPPRGALGRLRPEGDPNKDEATAVLDVARPGPDSYPDPAASLMVLRLRRPDDPAGWIGEPVVIPINKQGAYPDLLPVRLEVVRTAQSRHLRAMGQAWLGPGERVLRDVIEAIAWRGMPIATVELALRPGEDVQLDAWCVPTIDQLVDWFDIVETACVLATHAGRGTTAAQRCAAGLQALVGTASAGGGAVPPNLPECSGLGGLPVPGPEGLTPLAGMLHQAMMREPVLAVAAVQTLRVTHATDRPVTAPQLAPGRAQRLMLARRVLGQEPGAASGPGAAELQGNLLDFLAATPALDWTLGSNDEGATTAAFGGAVNVDLASTVAIELRASSAGVRGRLLDDPRMGRTASDRLAGRWPPHSEQKGFDALFGFSVAPGGRVTFQRHDELALRLDGLPLPSDAAPGSHTLLLEALQAAALGGSKVYGSALRTSIGGAFGDPGARLLTVTPVGIARHAGLFSKGSAGGAHESKGPAVEVWLPSTKRPAPPVLHDIAPLPAADARFSSDGVNGWRTVGQERRTRIRIRLKRPWYSSGEGERLGLVLWPPGLFARGAAVDELGSELPDVPLIDADLGPGGQFVTRWATDAIRTGGAPSQLIPRAVFLGPDELWSEVPRTFMPLPSDGMNGASAAATAFFTVALLTAEPRFDPVDELWFVDFDMRMDRVASPLLRFGLVRYQPNAREDEHAQEGDKAVRLRTSTPVSTWLPPLPARSTEVTWRNRDGVRQVIVSVRGGTPTGDPKSGSPQIGIRIELLRQASGSGGRLLALDLKGDPCRWESWNRPSEGLQPVSGGWACACRFEIAADGEHWVFVEEIDRMLQASSTEDRMHELGETGPRFLAVLPLAT